MVLLIRMAKTILLTGGTGFLGSNLLRRLKADGAKVLLLKRSSSNPWRISSELGDCQFYNADETPLEQIFKDHRIDLVIHCATNYGRSQVAVTDILQANLTLPLHLLQLSAQNGVSAFVNTDTILDKGVSAYSLSKKQFSDWLGVFSDRLLCVNVAIEHFFGPGDDPSKFVSSMVKRMISGDPEIELSPGTQKRDFIYIDDVVAAFEKIIVFCQNN
jgi:nucleoside-diphosphate-sugar epimerase